MNLPHSMENVEAEVGMLVVDRNYDRTCVVLGVRAKSLLVALRQRNGRTQLRWRPRFDLAPVALQGPQEALGLALACLKTRVKTSPTVTVIPAKRVPADLRLMLLRRPFGTPKAANPGA